MFSANVVSQITKVADRYNIEPAALLAVVEVESAGTPFWTVNGTHRPAIRFEGHWFYKLLSGAKRRRAVAAGLANPKVGGVRNPANWTARYALLDRAIEIDEDAALKATSWGLGQVMGFNYKKLGFSTVQELVSMAGSGVHGQVELMSRYIKAFGLIDELQNRDWLGFAIAYNGPAARKYRYDQKITKAYLRYSSMRPGKPPVKALNLTAQVQADLKKLGYYNGPVDGSPNTKTKAALRKFQSDSGIAVDGKYGPMTDAAIDRALAKQGGVEGRRTASTGTVTAGAGVGVEMVKDQLNALTPYTDYSDVLRYVVIALVLSGLALTVYGLWKNYRAEKILTESP